MKIDRSRFLALVGAIAGGAAACSTQPPPVVAVPAEQDPDASAAAAPIATSVAIATAEPPAASSEPPARNRKVHPVEEDHVLGLGDADTNSAAPYTFKGKSCPAADNMKGNPGSCATLKAPGPTCESFSDTKAQCGNLRTMFKPRIAEKIVDCHLKKSGTANICKFNLANDCVLEALPEACVEPGAANLCKPLMQKCGTTRWGKLSDDACAAAVSAISDAQKSKFISCVAEFCRFETCVYSYIPPTQESGRKPPFRR